MELDNRHDEQNTSSTLSLADTVISHSRWARSVISPWVQRTFNHARRPGSAGISAAYTLDRLQRVHHKAYEANAWRPDVGAASPAALQQFAGTIIRRHQSFQDKAAARISHPQSEQDTLSGLPLAHPGGVRVATESDDSRSPTAPTRSSSPSTPAQPPQPSSQSPVRLSPSSHVSPSQSSASESMPPLPSNHPLNTGDVPTKRVQRHTSPSISTPTPPSQQPPKRRRIYSRVEEITPGGRMTDDSASSSEASVEPAPSSEQSVHEEDTDVATKPAAAPDDPSTADSDGESIGATVQRTAREDTPASPTQPKSADSDSTSAPRRQDSQQRQQPASPTQTRDASTMQRTPDDTERAASLPSESQSDEAIRLSEERRTPEDDVEVSNDLQRKVELSEPDRAPAAPQPDDEVQVSEEPQAVDEPADDVTAPDGTETDMTSVVQPAESPAVREERSPDQPQQSHTSESPLETHSPPRSHDATIQRREQPLESAKAEPAASSQQSTTDTDVSPDRVQPAADRDDIPSDVDDIEAPTSPAEKAQPSSVQQTPDGASKRHPSGENREDAASSEQPPAPTTKPSTADQFEDETDQIDVSESPMTSAKEAGSQPPSGGDIAQRTWDTPATQPSQRPAEPAERSTPERPTDAGDTNTANSIGTPTTTSEESEATPRRREPDDVEPVEQSGPDSTTEEPVRDASQIQRSPEHDAGIESESSPDQQQLTELPLRHERSAEQETPATPAEPPALSSAKPEASTEIELAADDPSRVQRQHRDESISPAEEDPESMEPEPAPPVESDSGVETPSARQDATASDEAPASVQREPDLTGEHTETLQHDAPEPDTSDEQPVAQHYEAPTSPEPATIQRDSDRSSQPIDSQEDHPPSKKPSQDTTTQRSAERDTSDETTVQQQLDAPPEVPQKRAAEQSPTVELQPDDDTTTRTRDDTIPDEPARRSTVDEHMTSEGILKPSDDAPAPPQQPVTGETDVETQSRPTPDSSLESTKVQRTTNGTAPIQTDDISRAQDVASESDAPSEPASPTQQDMSHKTPSSDEASPTAPRSTSEEQPDSAPARDVQSTQPRPRAQIQRELDDDGESTATASDATPARRANAGPQSEPASSEETTPSGDDTRPSTHVQRQADYPSSPDASDTMPLADPRPVPPAKPQEDDTPTDSTIQPKRTEDVSTPRSTPKAHEPEMRSDILSTPGDRSPASSEPDSDRRRTLRRNASGSVGEKPHEIAGAAIDTHYAIRKAPASDHSPPSSELPTGSLEQTLVSRAKSRSRLPLATRHIIRRKPVSPSDDPGLSQPTQVLRRVRTQIETHSPHVDETREQSNGRTPDTQPQPIDDRRHTPVPEPSQVAKTQSVASGETLARDMQPAPQVSPPVFTPAARTPNTTLIQRTPLEYVQRVQPATGSETRQEPASETTSERDTDERDKEQEISLDRLARDVYPLIKRMIAIEHERRPGR